MLLFAIFVLLLLSVWSFSVQLDSKTNLLVRAIEAVATFLAKNLRSSQIVFYSQLLQSVFDHVTDQQRENKQECHKPDGWEF